MIVSKLPRLRWTYLLYAIFALFLVLLGWQVVAGSGLLPSDTVGTEPIASPDETGSGSGHMNLGAWTWTLALVALTIVVGLAIAWGEYQTRRISRRDWEKSERKTKELYKSDP